MTKPMNGVQMAYCVAQAAHEITSEEYARAAMRLPRLADCSTPEDLAALEQAEDQLIESSGIKDTDNALSAARRALWDWGRGVALGMASPRQADEINNLFDK